VKFLLYEIIPRAGFNVVTGRFWPAGRMFDTPGLSGAAYRRLKSYVEELLMKYAGSMDAYVKKAKKEEDQWWERWRTNRKSKIHNREWSKQIGGAERAALLLSAPGDNQPRYATGYNSITCRCIYICGFAFVEPFETLKPEVVTNRLQ